jgi:tetratricopeptide (TPR) repeat protein
MAPGRSDGSDPVDRARELFDAGRRSFDDGQHAEALASFQEALTLARRPSLVLWVGHCYRRLDQPAKSLRHYQEFLSACGRDAIGAEDSVRRAQPACSAEVEEEVAGFVKAMKEIVGLVQEGEVLLKTGSAVSAMAKFRTAEKLSSWPVIPSRIAECLAKLGWRDEARATLVKPMEHWERYLSGWRAHHADRDAPDAEEARGQLAMLRRLETSLTATVSPQSQPAGEHQSYQAAPRRNWGWLASGIATVAAAAGFEAWAWVSYSKGNDLLATDPDFETYRTRTILGHALAGSMAVASGVSFYLYYRSGQRGVTRSATFGLLRTADGWMMAGGGRF